MTLPKGAPVVIPVVICICISYSMTSLAITRYKEVYGHNPWCHESSIAALIGLIVGGAIKFFTGSAVEFDNDVFFYVVLPPIIFSAGMSLKKKMFFRYISLITLFGVIGTIINFSLITAVAYHATRMFEFRDNIFDRPVNLSWEHAMLLAAVLSGTDEVSALSLMPMKEYPRLGALIFGEGVLNDAISIVLFHVLISNHATDDADRAAPIQELAVKLLMEVTIEVLLSFAIGVGCGLANARLLKSLSYMREHPIHQTVLLLLFAYLAYTIAESVGVSGILTLFVTAVTQGHYSWHSLSKPAQVATKINAVALSDIAEGFAFSYVGLSMWEYVDDGFHIQFSLFILFVVVFSRLITILTLCCICRNTCSGFQMALSEQLGFTLGGIVRGCLCWAQILQINEHRMLVTTTLFIVMTTSLAGGFLMPIIIPWLGLKAVKQIRASANAEDLSPKRETLLKRSYKRRPKHLANTSSKSAVSVEKGRSRQFSVYCFNNNAEAEDDLYASASNSPQHFLGGREDSDATNSALIDANTLWLNNPEACLSFDNCAYQYDTGGKDRDLVHSDEDLEPEDSTNEQEKNPHPSQRFLDRMRLPQNFSSWGSVGESFHKKTAHHRKPVSQGQGSLGRILNKIVNPSCVLENKYTEMQHLESSLGDNETEIERIVREYEEVSEGGEGCESGEGGSNGDYCLQGGVDNASIVRDELARGHGASVVCGAHRTQVMEEAKDEAHNIGGADGSDELSATETKAGAGAGSVKSGNWGDINRYKKMNYLIRDKLLPRSVHRLDTLLEEPNSKEHSKKSEPSSKEHSRKSEPSSREHSKKSDSNSSAPSSNALEVEVGLTSSGRVVGTGAGGLEPGPGSSQKVYKTASGFTNWVHFDEEFLKPLFGGSKREYTSIPDELRTPPR